MIRIGKNWCNLNNLFPLQVWNFFFEVFTEAKTPTSATQTLSACSWYFLTLFVPLIGQPEAQKSFLNSYSLAISFFGGEGRQKIISTLILKWHVKFHYGKILIKEIKMLIENYKNESVFHSVLDFGSFKNPAAFFITRNFFMVSRSNLPKANAPLPIFFLAVGIFSNSSRV